MKTRKNTQWKMTILAASAVMILSITACMKNKIGGAEIPVTKEVFDFATDASNILKVKYNVPKEYKVYFEVYTKTPLLEDGSKNPNIEPIDNGFTDENGVYENPVKLPAYIKEVFIYSPDVCVPRLKKAYVKDGLITTSSSSATTKGVTRASIPDKLGGKIGIKVDNGSEINAFVEWCNYDMDKKGKPLYAGYPIKESIIDNDDDNDTDDFQLWGRLTQMQYIDYRAFDKSGGQEDAIEITTELRNEINTILSDKDFRSKYTEKGADLNVKGETTVDVFLIDEKGIEFSTLTYYCYPTGQPLEQNEIKGREIVVFPNVQLIREHEENKNNKKFDEDEYGALLKGEGVRLHYYEYEEDGTPKDMGETFPAGVSIGLVLHVGAYDPIDGAINNGGQQLYSSLDYKNGKPHMAAFTAGGYSITSIEETFNPVHSSDFKDIILGFKGNVSNGSEDTPQPPVEDREETSTKHGVLAFEDVWPYQGDFDMNDVIVRYKCDVTKNETNEITKTVNNYTIVWSGALMNNTFCYEDSNISAGAGTVAITGGDGKSTQDGDVIYLAKNVLGYANNTEKTTFTVETTFTNPIAKDKFQYPPYNPFITANNDNAVEVHLTDAKPTAAANQSLLGTGHDVSKPESGHYYVTFVGEQQMPFAIHMMFDSKEDAQTFVLMEEKTHIDVAYPNFIKWILSGGEDCRDWYLK